MNPFHPSIPLARRLARLALISDEQFLEGVEEALLSAPREAWTAAPGSALAADEAFSQAFPPPDVYLLAPPDAEEDEIAAYGSLIFLERSLAQSCAFSEPLIALGSDFSSDLGARAREAFLSLAARALSDSASREPFLREALSAWLWTELAVPFEEPPLAEALGLEPFFWPVRLALRVSGDLSEEISHPFPEDPPIPLARAAMLALGCPPDRSESEWLLSALGGEEALAAAFGPLGAGRAAVFAADTLNSAILEALSESIPRGDELLARQAWTLCAEAAAEAHSNLLEPIFAEELPEEISLEEAQAARREASNDLFRAIASCSEALREPLGPPPPEILRSLPLPLRGAFDPREAIIVPFGKKI